MNITKLMLEGSIKSKGLKICPIPSMLSPPALTFHWSLVFLEFDIFDVEPYKVKGLLV